VTAQPVRRVGRPSNLARLSAKYTPAPPAPADPRQAEADALDALAAVLQRLATRLRTLDTPAPATPPAADGWLSLGEAAQLTRLGRTTLARWITRGHLPALRDETGAHYQPYRIRRSDLDGLVGARVGVSG
jgi:excisionase family DNA binding protein